MFNAMASTVYGGRHSSAGAGYELVTMQHNFATSEGFNVSLSLAAVPVQLDFRVLNKQRKIRE
jgi:hypothetical protein